MKPVFDENNVQIFQGDCRDVLAQMPAESVDCVVTSPPYFNLRDYGIDGQIGLEQTPDAYVAEMVSVFTGVWRVLKPEGTLWLNLGDSYNAYNGGRGYAAGANKNHHEIMPELPAGAGLTVKGLRNKNLLGIPWRVAFALQSVGWILRSDIIWHKPNPMPESVTDRCTKAHEYIFLLTKSERYFFNASAIQEAAAYAADDRAGRAQQTHKSMPTDLVNGIRPRSWRGSEFHDGKNLVNHPNVGKKRKSVSQHKQEAMGRCASDSSALGSNDEPLTRNKRSVWTVATQPYSGAHFATFPPELITPCIKAGVPDGGVCLDPFFGAGTTGLVCQQQHVRCIGIELNPDYVAIASKRLSQGVLTFTEPS
jgi:DNA modification methylase